jgi:hypothetical protein
MRFCCGKIPEEVGFDPAKQGWTPIKEPSPWVAQLCALPIGFIVVIGLWFCWKPAFSYASDDSSTFAAIFENSISFALLIFGGTIIIHELIHAAAHPLSGLSPKTILGVWPAKLLFYAHYEGTLSRNRFALILFAPFAALSLLPLLVCAGLGFFLPILFLVSIFSGVSACVDLLGTILILWQLPSCAVVRNLGWRTYYRTPNVKQNSE